MAKSVAPLTGLLILVVEDEVVLAMMLEDMLQDFGCTVTLASSVDEALAAIAKTRLDGVLLDMNVHGDTTFAIAEELSRRSVPFLLVTGYGDGESDPPVIKNAARLQKPFREEDLSRRMAEIFVPPAAAEALNL